MATISIGQLAQRSGVPIDTVRHYERIGLLKPAARLASGYRRYGEAEQKRLRFIRRAKALGFTLDEVQDLLALSAGRNVQSIRRAAAARLADVERRIGELGRVRDSLRQLIAACPGHGRAEACPILNALSQDSKS
ncbi:MAG TPA: heavy metal-responsive transcriptional regulator [Steroidobacteraceae bacterium]|nr:heavy metal-responsive transcriptional regulator [Steroidobacteraceae bacterium]